jgi:hypothetical protein
MGMKKRRWFISLMLLILGLRLELPALAQAPGTQPQGFSVTIMNICGSAPAPETIEILSVTLTVNGAPVATQVSRRSLKTGETTTFQFPVSQFPVLATFTPNDVTVSWQRGGQSFTTLFFPIQPGQSRDQLCLRVLLTSGLEGETGTIFNQTRSLISGTAGRLGVSVNPDHAKLFQIGNVPIAMAPATGAGPTIGVMETGLPMTIGSSLLPPGSYKMNVDFTTRKISFINPMGMEVAQTDAQIEPVAGPSAATSEPLTLTTTSTCQATTSSSEEPVEPMAFTGCVGPTISFSLTFIPTPPFVLLLTCIGFLCHPFHPLPPYVSISFCF